MSRVDIALIIAGMAVITYSLRLSFFLLQDRVVLPASMRAALRYAPAAVLMALITPSLFYRQGELALSAGNERIWAALIATAIAWHTRSTLTTIAGGMAALWLLQALGV